MIKLWHFSDSHQFHGLLKIPEVDMVIFSGDCSNPRNPYQNEQEVRNFIYWFSNLPIKHKVFIAGNHSTAIEKKLVTKIDFQSNNIIYLENDFIEIEGLKIWGSPITPSYGEGWAFNMARHKLHSLWATIPEDTDIVISHGPPKGILDLSYSIEGKLEFCGCKALRNRMLEIQPKLCLFGHIHNNEDVINAGYAKLSEYKTIFSNGSIVTDGKFGRLSSNGNIFEI